MINHREILEEWTNDPSVIQRFMAVWPLVDESLSAFSRATDMPIWVFMRGTILYQSTMDSMPPLCRKMLSEDDTRRLCVLDGAKRAAGDTPEHSPGTQMCHMGMLNGRKEIEIGHLGVMVILFGARRSDTDEAASRRERRFEGQDESNSEQAEALRSADGDDHGRSEFRDNERELMNAVTALVTHLFDLTVGFHWVSVNMAHELANMMIGTGLMMRDLEEELEDARTNPERLNLAEFHDIYAGLIAESRLGLYVVRNFLSHVSETRYAEVVEPKFSPVNLKAILEELVSIHRRVAARKGVDIALHVDGLPTVYGVETEIRRAFHNVLSNAVKYSYRSLPNQPREVRVGCRVPFDPGFRQTRLALTFENYGLGVSDDERPRVTKAGFRGSQAIKEVPIGSGIGLSEVKKIMTVHGGELKYSSRPLHATGEGATTYLTLVQLIFPYRSS